MTLLLTACGEHKHAKVDVPAPPPMVEPEPDTTTEHPQKSEKQPSEEEETISVAADAKPLVVETGIASWYGAPYHNRPASNGKAYNMHAMTAAHRTLPLGSVVRVTNLKTGRATLVRITDRGPFIQGRILDLSLAAAKAVDVWLPGIAKVKMEVLQAPSPIETGGRWAVQIGAFEKEKAANALADHLSRRYRTAKVLRFASPVGDWWVRVRVQNDERSRAEELAHDTHTPEGTIFLVRLD